MAVRWTTTQTFGQGLVRAYLAPHRITNRVLQADARYACQIDVFSREGFILGKIRNDVQRPILSSLEFTINENGCADFKMSLVAKPAFEILPFSIVKVRLFNSDFYWYAGEIIDLDDDAPNRDTFEYKGRGLKRYLAELTDDRDFNGTSDLGEIVRDIVETTVAPNSPIGYAFGKLENPIGVALVSDVEMGAASIDKVFESLATMADATWGIDGDADVYFNARETALQRTFFLGYGAGEFSPKINLGAVKNSILVQRQQGRGAGGAGWAVAGIYSDTTSIRKYGKKELRFQVPGYFSDDDCQAVGEALLAARKDPKFSGTLSGIPITTPGDYLSPGVYRVILPFDEYEVEASALDSAADWTVTALGDLALSDDTTNFIYGTGSVKLTFQTADQDRAEFSPAVVGTIKRIRFYIRSTKPGALVTVGVGETTWNEATRLINFGVVNRFFRFDWDVSAENFSQIGKIGFRVEGDQAAETSINVDKLDILIAGNKTYRLDLAKATYKIAPGDFSVDAEFGEVPPKLENYLTTLFKNAEENKYTGELN